jgi:SPP1 gp7 family putative phage head morphogenesis protein
MNFLNVTTATDMARKPKLCDPIFPNAGVESWYRKELQERIVKPMATEMLAAIRDAGTADVVADTAPRKAAGVMFQYRDQVLLLHRTDGLGWALPGGGVEEGETYQEAARREVYEEMGPLPEYGPLELIDVQKGPVRYVTFHVDVGLRFTPTLNSEHDGYMWIRPEVALVNLGLHPGVAATLMQMSTAGIAQDAKAMKPSASPLLRKALSKWASLWTRRLDNVSHRIARDFAVRNKNATDAAMLGKLAKAGFTVKFKPTKASTNALDAVIAENVGLIRSIPQKFLADVEVQVWQAVMAGSDMDTLSRNIKEKYGVAWRRAALIASDQNAKAKAAMERARREEVGITKAQWMHSHAGVTPRPTHVAMDGETYEVSKGMWDSAVQKFIWPGTEINCRCSDKAVVPGFD